MKTLRIYIDGLDEPVPVETLTPIIEARAVAQIGYTLHRENTNVYYPPHMIKRVEWEE